ncbi:MAG: hypothetical protein F4Y63_07590 [Chloroflexi bacterium]|nr:hypothetical protein [Chloroflexota bacterium]MYF80126.1 hypothetical protein [Chloroflexota bacterium]MYK61643.1 hypothetical protein [Chloroflexota bacterium]
MKLQPRNAKTLLIAAFVSAMLGILLVACSSPEPTATPVPPTHTPVPPTATPVPPTPTPVPPTPTPVPPTPTPVPPTATPVPPTATPEPTEEPEAEQIDEISPSGLSAHDAVCIEEHADAETAAKVFEAIEALTTGDDAENQHILDLLAAAEPLSHCGVMPERFAPIVAQISPEDAECVVEQAGVAMLMNFFTITEEQQAQTLNLMALAPLLGSLQACDVALDLTAGQ